MGCILNAIDDDIEDYEILCEKFGDKVQYKTGESYNFGCGWSSTHSSPDCYGKHCRKLKERNDAMTERG